MPITLIGPTGLTFFADAVIDTGSDECLVPYTVLPFIEALPRSEAGHRVTWRGKQDPIVYADISLFLTDGAESYRWPATVAFTPAPIKYILLGVAACLEYFDARCRGADQTVELEANWKYPGTR